MTLVDVGSMGGVEAEWLPLRERGELRVIGFEPDDREFAGLSQDERTVFHNRALWSEARKPLSLYVAREAGKTSLYQPNMDLLRRYPRPERFETVREIRLPAERVGTLDDTVGTCDFVKLDTQGSELDILRGGKRTLSTALGLKVEVEFLELYKGQPLFADVDLFLRDAGFELVDLRRVYWKRRELLDFYGKGQLAFGDALYLRSPETVAAERTAAYAAICGVYGLRDLAAALSGARKADPGYSIRLPGRNRIIRWMRALSRAIGRSDQGFADADAGLGNV